MSTNLIFRMAFDALEGNKTRTALTMLGVIIGVAAVITMIALGRGAQSAIEAQVRSAGTNLIVVMAGNVTLGGVRQGQGAASTLVPEDADAVRQLTGVRYAAAGVSTRLQAIAGSQNWMTRVEGTDVDFPAIRAWPMRYGGFFTSQDVRSLSNVAVLGSVVSEALFGVDFDPTGQIIRLKNQPFRVLGVLTSKGVAAMGQDPDDSIVAPYSTVQKKLLGATFIQSITVSAESANNVPQVAAAISDLLRVRHRLTVGESDDFMVRTLEEMASLRTETAQTMSMLLAGIAAVSLLVGGIGIMNIMLVSVAERTREIGLRMAIGAKSRDVLLQFLVEAATISLAGGALGIALGFGLSQVFTALLAWPTVFAFQSVALAFGFSAVVGIFFGFYPARRAASLDPIEALRYE